MDKQQLLASKTVDNYYANDPESIDLHTQPSTTPQVVNTVNNTNTKNKKLFPQKLWDLINDNKYNFCLRWSDDGQLVYLNRDDFEDSYLKTTDNQFHTQKAISFVRQMNMYGFRKVDDCYYENDNFKKNCEHLLKNMIRKHPNKNPNLNEISPFLYKSNSSSILLSQSPSASILTSSSPINSNFLDCRQRISYPLYDRPMHNEMDKMSNKAQDNNHHKQQHVLEDERFNEDSLSSSGDYCCSAGSSHGETLATVLDRIDSNNQSDTHDREIPLLHKQEQQHMNLFSQDASKIFDPIHFRQQMTRDSSPIEDGDGTNYLHNDQFINLPPVDNLNINLRATTNSNNNNCNDLNIQQQSFQSIYNDQQELIKVLISQQQSNTQFPRDLTTTSIKGQLNIQPENSNLNALCALLSSFNNNLYQSSTYMQNDRQNLAFDISKFSSLQQIYQHILAPQGQSLTTNERSRGSNISSIASLPAKDFEGLALNSSILDKDSSSISLLARNKTMANPIKSGRSMNMLENNHRNECQLSNRSHDKHKTPIELESSTRRRDSRSNRSFKRHVDSILDSNNNNSPDRSQDYAKKIKIEINSENCRNEHVIIERIVNKFAKDLVTEVASARDARVDANVIYEASKYTERFVETLFDTAQVIARHSNGSVPSDSILMNDNCLSTENRDSNYDKEIERSNINLNDLISAVKLLPSKLLKILK